MLIDCDSCAVRGPACRDCVVSVLLGAPAVRNPGRTRHSGPVSPPGRAVGEHRDGHRRGHEAETGHHLSHETETAHRLGHETETAHRPGHEPETGHHLGHEAELGHRLGHEPESGVAPVAARVGERAGETVQHRVVQDIEAGHATIDLDAQEQAAIAVLAGAGLVPSLRLVVRPVDPDEAGVLNWDHEPRDSGRTGRHGDHSGLRADHRAAG